jgi:predicted HTH domain antitoxin
MGRNSLKKLVVAGDLNARPPAAKAGVFEHPLGPQRQFSVSLVSYLVSAALVSIGRRKPAAVCGAGRNSEVSGGHISVRSVTMKMPMKLEIEVAVADDAVDKSALQEHLRKEAILALFADRRIPAGKAARELGLERIAFLELLQQRGIPYVVYTLDDWDADARALDEFERRRKAG